MTFRGRYSAIINRIVTTEAKIRLVSASHPANAEITLSAPPRKPVMVFYICYTGFDFGQMKLHEGKAPKGGLFPDG